LGEDTQPLEIWLYRDEAEDTLIKIPDAHESTLIEPKAPPPPTGVKRMKLDSLGRWEISRVRRAKKAGLSALERILA
jgi:hypothetical protein